MVPVCLCEHGRERSKCKQRVRPRRPLQARAAAQPLTARTAAAAASASTGGIAVATAVPVAAAVKWLPIPEVTKPACSPPIFDLPPPVLLPTLEIPLT